MQFKFSLFYLFTIFTAPGLCKLEPSGVIWDAERTVAFGEAVTSIDKAIRELPEHGHLIGVSQSTYIIRNDFFKASVAGTAAAGAIRIGRLHPDTPEDISDVLQAVNGVRPVIVQMLNDLVTKKPYFMYGTAVLISNALETFSHAVSEFDKALADRLPESSQGSIMAFKNATDSAIASAIRTYAL